MQTFGPDNQIAGFSDRTGSARTAGNKVAGLLDFIHNLNGIGINRNIASKTVVSDVKASGDSSKQ